ncbi:hypothetical protein EV426DRAFT_707046 [Tirmania nivea]|nr:hypothetical protein EV426DRAFT_707046 [Tirmania nivea]
MEKTPIVPSPAIGLSAACVAERLAVDAASAAAAAALVAPLITIIDRGIMENASGKRPLAKSVRAGLAEMVKRPHRFLWSRPFALVFMLYSGTYLTANAVDTMASLQAACASPAPTDIKTVTTGTPKFLATTAANMSLCLYKDRTFTRLFSTLAPRPVPLPTYLLFSTRDALSIFFSFNLPPVIAPLLPADPSTGAVAGWDKIGWGGWQPQTVAQLAAPAACQVLSTPLHLLGLDLYNRPRRADARPEGPAGRWARVRREWAKSTVARVARIVPAFGAGGVVNAGVRRRGLEGVEQRWT